MEWRELLEGVSCGLVLSFVFFIVVFLGVLLLEVQLAGLFKSFLELSLFGGVGAGWHSRALIYPVVLLALHIGVLRYFVGAILLVRRWLTHIILN